MYLYNWNWKKDKIENKMLENLLFVVFRIFEYIYIKNSFSPL